MFAAMASSTAGCRRRRARVERGRSALRGSLVLDLERRLAEMERRFAEQERRHAREVAKLKGRIAELTETIAVKDRRIAELESQLARARKTSRNSSKPPASDHA